MIIFYDSQTSKLGWFVRRPVSSMSTGLLCTCGVLYSRLHKIRTEYRRFSLKNILVQVIDNQGWGSHTEREREGEL